MTLDRIPVLLKAMARCLGLQNFSVDDANGECLVELTGWGLQPVEWFERIVCAAFASSGFTRASEILDSGLLGFEKVLVLAGTAPEGGGEQVKDFLLLLARSLTIEDSLDESHSLGYHQDEDETGGLVRSNLGTLVYHAKYRHRVDERERIRHALCSFIRGHPRYRRADAVAAILPHETGRTGSLCQRLLAEVGSQLGLQQVQIVRVTTTQPQKEIADDDRRKGVERRFANQEGTMRVNHDLAGSSAVVLDDLYGSGASMHEAARVLRQAGAAEVLGLTVTKQRLYQGVRLATLD